MRTRRALPYGLAVAGLLGLSCLAWFHSAPASAQQGAQQGQVPGPQAFPTQPNQQGQAFQPGGPMMRGLSMGATAMTANNSYVYVLRGNTILALRANDLSFVGQAQLPSPPTEQRQQGVPPGAPSAPGAP